MTERLIRVRSLNGTLWMAGAGAAISVANLGIFAVVARLIQPVEFGVVAFAAVCIEFVRIAFLSIVTDAVISRSTTDDTANSTAFWSAMLIGGICTVVCLLVFSPMMERYYADGAGWIFAAITLVLLLEAPRCVHEGLLKRSFQYRAIAWRMALATLAGGVLAIPLAMAGLGAWALVVQRLGRSALQLLISWHVLPWRPAWRYSVVEARTLLRFCAHAGFGRVLSQIGDKVPEAIIGAVMGLEALAYYQVGTRGLDSVSQLVVQPPTGVALSALAQVDPRQYEEQFLRILRLVAIIAVPAYFGASVVAPEFIALLFGPRWSQSAIVMSFLGLTAVPCVTLALIGPLLLAAGKPRLLTLTALVNVGLTGVAVLAASFVSLPAVAMAQLVGSHAGLLIITAMVSKAMGFSRVQLLKGLGPALLAGGLMTITLVGLRDIIDQKSLILQLLLLSGSGVVLYSAFLILFFRAYTLRAWREIAPSLPARFRGVKPPSV